MSNNLSLLNLPSLPLFAILKNLSFGDLFVFLMLSKRAAMTVKEARIKLGHFEVSCSSKSPRNTISVGLESDKDSTFQVIMHTRLHPMLEAHPKWHTFRRRKIQYKLWSSNSKMEGYSKCSRVIVMMLAEYFLDVFPRSRITSLSLDNVYLKYLEKFQETEFLTVTDVGYADFDFPQVTTTAKVTILNPGELSIETVAGIRAPRVSLRPEPKVYPYNGSQLQTFVRRWLASSETTLESFDVPYDASEWPRWEILNGLPTMASEKQSRCWPIDKEYCFDCSPEHSYDVQRADGLAATILFDEDTFRFLVWHDSFLGFNSKI